MEGELSIERKRVTLNVDGSETLEALGTQFAEPKSPSEKLVEAQSAWRRI